MDVDVGLAVRVANFGGVDMGQPVVGNDLARHVQDQPAQRVALVRVGVDPPVLLRQVFVHRPLHVHRARLVLP